MIDELMIAQQRPRNIFSYAALVEHVIKINDILEVYLTAQA